MNRAFLRATGLLFYFLLLITPIWSVKYPALLDYPDHLLRVKIARGLHDGATGWEHYYQYRWTGLRTYYFFDGTTFLLSFPFGVFTAGKLTLSICVLLLLAAGLALLKARGQPFWPFGLWPALFVYNWWFNGGSIDLLAGYAFAMLGLAAFVSGLPHRLKMAAAACAFLAAAAAHPLAFLLGAAVLVWIVFARSRSRNVRLGLAAAYFLLLLAASLLSHTFLKQSFEPVTKLNRILWLLHDWNPSIEVPLMRIALLGAIAIWIAGVRRMPAGIAAVPVLVVMMAFLVPSWVSHVGFTEMRFGLFALLIFPLSLQAPNAKIIRTVLSCILLSAALVWHTGQIQKQRSLKPFYAEIEQAAMRLPARARVRPVLEFTGSPEQKAFFYCSFYKDGYTPFMLVSPLCGLTHANGFRPVPATMAAPDSAEANFYDALLVYKQRRAGDAISVQNSSDRFAKAFSGKFIELLIRNDSRRQP